MKRQKVRKALGIISFLLLPITMFYFSPVLVIYGASQGMAVGSFAVFGLLFAFSLIFGRAYCGWVCPTGAFQEWEFAVSRKKTGRKLPWIKYMIWAPWLFFIVFLFFRAGGVRKTDLLFATDHGVSIGNIWMWIIYYSVMTVFVVLPFILGKRAACHGVCWMAPFMVTGTKLRNFLRFPGLRLAASPASCTNCKVCTENCPMSLDVNAMVQNRKTDHAECILCGTCVDGCKKGAIGFTWKSNRQR